MPKKPRERFEEFDSWYQLSIEYEDWETLESDAQEEREARITEVLYDVHAAYEFTTDEELRQYYKELRATFGNDCQWDQFVSPAMLRTDFMRAIKSRYSDANDVLEPEARSILRTYGNDHVLTVLIRFLVAEDVEEYREHVQLNTAACDPILFKTFPDKFKWLRDEYMARAVEKKEREERRIARLARKQSDDDNH